MTTIINAVSGTGLTYAADGSGNIKVQSNGVTTNALAWVNFDGTLSGTITPRANYNISSITKSSTSTYALNFTNSLTDVNYAVVASCGSGTVPTFSSSTVPTVVSPASIPTTSSVTIALGQGAVGGSSGVASAASYVYVVVFGN